MLKKFSELEKNNGSSTLDQVADSVGKVIPSDHIIPGRFYSFEVMTPLAYLDGSSLPSLAGNKPYYNLNPVGFVFFHQHWLDNRKIVMLDLKVIPPIVVAKLLEAYYHLCSQYGMDRLYDNAGVLKPLTERRSLDLPFYRITPTQMCEMLPGLNSLNYAINTYKIQDVARARLIDWDQYGSMIQPKVSTRGMYPDPIDMEEVFNGFIQNATA